MKPRSKRPIRLLSLQALTDLANNLQALTDLA